MEADGLTTEKIWVDFGDDSPQEIDKTMIKRIAEAEKNRLRNAEEEGLREMIKNVELYLNLDWGVKGQLWSRQRRYALIRMKSF